MLNVLKERLLDGMEIAKVKEKPSKYEITFLISGGEIKEELPKTCTPGRQDRVVDHTIFNAMCKAEIAKGNYQAAKDWLDKIITRKDDEQ
jgi:hypothetical protein